MIIKTNKGSNLELIVLKEGAFCRCTRCGYEKEIDLTQKALDLLLLLEFVAESHENCKVDDEVIVEKSRGTLTLKKDLPKPTISAKEIAELYEHKKPEGRFAIAVLKKFAVDKYKKQNSFSGLVEIDDGFIKNLFDGYKAQFS